ncbi:hypothetical protein [Henriciella sp.]|uniref:hypothetical protein n=1 Tax=Henriciella sp. TaxID=1968823 RepID=UPI000C0DC6D8|nr:hypothetical protein [Henriciella sp.]PHR83080.1 MAG: hypothetical protein COA64_00035 [Henriciella sp.]
MTDAEKIESNAGREARLARHMAFAMRHNAPIERALKQALAHEGLELNDSGTLSALYLATDTELDECAVLEVRKIAHAASGGNCTFVDDDVKRLVWERDNAEKALDGDEEALAAVRKEQASRAMKLGRLTPTPEKE